MTAAERYTARKERTAVGLRERTIAAADAGARHARLQARYGPGWRRHLNQVCNWQQAAWEEIVERNPVYYPRWRGVV